MKKKVFIISVLSIFLLPLFVNASTKCNYVWPEYSKDFDWNITLSELNENNVFTKITAGQNAISSGIEFAEEVKLNDNGTCPNIVFYSGYWVGDKIYASGGSCEKSSCIEVEPESQDDSDKSDENSAGVLQAALTNSASATTCRYEHITGKGKAYESKVTIYISKTDGKITARCTDTALGIGNCGVENINNAGFEADESYKCPSYIYYKYRTDNGVSYCSIQGQGGEADDNESGIEKPNPDEDSPDIGFEVGELDCDGIFQGNFGKILKQIMDLVKFAVPIIIIALSVVDYVKSLAAQNQDEMKKSTQKLVKRLIIGVLIFVLPTILEFVLKIAGIEFGVCAIG